MTVGVCGGEWKHTDTGDVGCHPLRASLKMLEVAKTTIVEVICTSTMGVEVLGHDRIGSNYVDRAAQNVLRAMFEMLLTLYHVGRRVSVTGLQDRHLSCVTMCKEEDKELVILVAEHSHPFG